MDAITAPRRRWRIWGASLAELFENAAGALMATMTDRRLLRPRETRDIFVEAIEDIALARVIDEGAATKTVEAAEVYEILKGRP